MNKVYYMFPNIEQQMTHVFKSRDDISSMEFNFFSDDPASRNNQPSTSATQENLICISWTVKQVNKTMPTTKKMGGMVHETPQTRLWSNTKSTTKWNLSILGMYS